MIDNFLMVKFNHNDPFQKQHITVILLHNITIYQFYNIHLKEFHFNIGCIDYIYSLPDSLK